MGSRFPLFIPFVVLTLSVCFGVFYAHHEEVYPIFHRDIGKIRSGFLLERDDVPYVIGHQGIALSPQNTIMSSYYALECDADGLHANLRLNVENELFLFPADGQTHHTNISTSFSSMKTSEISSIDAGFNYTVSGEVFPFRSKGLTIPTFYEWAIRYQKTPIILELEDNSQEITDELISELRRLIEAVETFSIEKISRQVLITSKYRTPLLRYRERTKAQLPSSCSEEEAIYIYFLYKLGHSIAAITREYELDIFPKCDALVVPMYIGDDRDDRIHFVDPRFIDFAHSLSLAVVVRGANTKASLQELMDANVDGILTDRVDLAKEILAGKDASQLVTNLRKYQTEPRDTDYICATLLCQFVQSEMPCNPFHLVLTSIFFALAVLGGSIGLILSCCYRVLVPLSTPPKEKQETNGTGKSVSSSKKQSVTPTQRAKGKKQNKKTKR